MLETAMVENHVHHHFKTFLMCLVDELAILCISAKAWIYAIVVGGSIAM